MTAKDLLAIIGDLDDLSTWYLPDADRAAVNLLKGKQGVLISPTTHHHEAFEALAKAFDGDDMKAAEAALKGVTSNDGRHAEDVVLKYAHPLAEAAYHIGLAVGLRIAAGGK